MQQTNKISQKNHLEIARSIEKELKAAYLKDKKTNINQSKKQNMTIKTTTPQQINNPYTLKSTEQYNFDIIQTIKCFFLEKFDDVWDTLSQSRKSEAFNYIVSICMNEETHSPCQMIKSAYDKDNDMSTEKAKALVLDIYRFWYKTDAFMVSSTPYLSDDFDVFDAINLKTDHRAIQFGLGEADKENKLHVLLENDKDEEFLEWCVDIYIKKYDGNSDIWYYVDGEE